MKCVSFARFYGEDPIYREYIIIRRERFLTFVPYVLRISRNNDVNVCDSMKGLFHVG